MYGTLNINIPTIKPPFHLSQKPKIGFLSNTGVAGKSMRGPCAVSVAAAESTASSVGGSLYEVLRVDPKATINEIKTAYRSLAKVYHPDLSGDGRDFIEIHNAYETLSDPSSRAIYDLSLVANRRRRARSVSYGYSGRSGFYPTRKWETDQCW